VGAGVSPRNLNFQKDGEYELDVNNTAKEAEHVAHTKSSNDEEEEVG
jgi:hypothetical protein